MRDLIEHCEDVGADRTICTGIHEEEIIALKHVVAGAKDRSIRNILEQDEYLISTARPLYLRDHVHVGLWALNAERNAAYWAAILFPENNMPESVVSDLSDILHSRPKIRRKARTASRKRNIFEYATRSAEVGFWQFSAEDLIFGRDSVLRMRQQIMHPMSDSQGAPAKLIDWKSTSAPYDLVPHPENVRYTLAVKQAEQCVLKPTIHGPCKDEAGGGYELIPPGWLKETIRHERHIHQLARKIKISDEEVAAELNRRRHANLKSRYEHAAGVVFHTDNLMNSVPVKMA